MRLFFILNFEGGCLPKSLMMPSFYGMSSGYKVHILCAIGRDDGEILERTSFPTTTPSETIGRVINFFSGKHIAALGVGSFGPVDLDLTSKSVYVTAIMIGLDTDAKGKLILKHTGISMNSRHHQILMLLLDAKAPVTLREISNELKISIRTIQRELDGLGLLVKTYELMLVQKPGVGLSLKGTENAKKQLFHQLSVMHGTKIFSPEERQYILMQMLLSLREPTKLYYFSSKLDVTEATISNDLDKLEPWFAKHHIQLVRKQGLGVFIEGNEKNIREAIVDLLYKHFTQEQLMDILSSYSYSFSDKVKLELSISNHLLHFIEPKTIDQIENVVKLTKKLHGYEMTDSAYVGFVIHIALAVQRLKNGENISIDAESLQKLKKTDEFEWALQMARKLDALLEIEIPESEVGYITMHLLGAKGKRVFSLPIRQEDLRVEHFVQQMIRIVENELKHELGNDVSLFESLSTHLESAIHRLLLKMDIRNPLLDRIRTEYPDVFIATSKAALYLERQLNCPVPDEEIGYLAMHFGASIVRKTGKSLRGYRILLACASGMGTSRLLAAQIEKNLPHIRIVDIVSLLNLEKWLRKKLPVDLIISTVPFENENYKVIVVNSFLHVTDIELIEQYLKNLPISEKPQTEVDEEIEDTVMKINRYGEAILLLMNHTFIVSELTAFSKDDVILQASAFVGTQLQSVDVRLLEDELRKREKLGGLVFEKEQFSMLHCRSEAIPSVCICLFRLVDEVQWNNLECHTPVRTILLLLAPRSVPKEHIEMISEISAALIEEEFIKTLIMGDDSTVKYKIKAVLGKGYRDKTTSVFRGS
ncbi:mannitol operon transcriptional antiterminator [Paenibacillus sp. V4I9]|nr:mannitol operon transcriptional antiterminator [Paenibacillus sp. V4I9]